MSDYRTTTGQPPPVPRSRLRHRRWKFVKLIMVGLAAIVAAGVLVRTDRYIPASGYVTTTEYAEVCPAIEGVVAKVVVESGVEVKAGDLLVQLDDSQEKALRDEAMSRVRKAEAELSRRKAEIAEENRELEKNVSVARLRLEHASAKLKLTEELAGKGLASGRALEDEKLNERLAREELDGLLSKDRTLADKELEVPAREVEASRNAVVSAEAAVRARRVHAPISGRAVRYTFVVGELVRPDMVLYEVFGGKGEIIKLRVPERYATQVAPGQRCRVELLSYGGVRRLRFPGTVKELRDVIESENRQTYRVAYCSFDPQGHPVPPGTTAEARINVGRSSFWAYLFGVY